MKAAVLVLTGLALLSPPSGRPPAGPLERYDPKVHDLKYEVLISSDIPFRQDDPRLSRPHRSRNPRFPRLNDNPRELEFGGIFEVADAPIVMPVIYRGAYHQVANDTVRGEIWLGDSAREQLQGKLRIDDGLPFHTHIAVLPIASYGGKTIRWNLSFRQQSFSSRIDDAAAQQIAWPREWPKEVADGLKPQMFIESDDPIFAETVQRVSEGNLRLVPPYLAAKDLVRYCINEFQVSGDGLHWGRFGVLHGMEVLGAANAAREGRGSPHDLVCICVAMLRAAGIPARPVIGVTKSERDRKVLVTWAEFYLPEAGWVPFDPNDMRGKGVRNRDVKQPWGEFGTMKDLHDRIPLAYHFMPPMAVESPQNPALWGWDPRPNGAPEAEQRITLTTVSRGRGVEDPE